MSIDQYSLCPCGNGKKLKFCKCVDQPQEYEKIARMMVANQDLAALDRINQLLAKTPSTAWLLALKCEISLRLEEMDTFRDTAIRFLKLKPDNPLALVMRSTVACATYEPVDVAARYLLEGLAEFREHVHSFAFIAINTLIVTMLKEGKGAYCSFWEDILAGFAEAQDIEHEPMSREADLNLLVRSPNLIIADPPSAPWIERLTEVGALAHTFRYAQAETKLRSIVRDFPDQPGPLSNLLRAQIILIDEHGAIATARKLASLKEVPQAQRDYFMALALELEGNHGQLATKLLCKFCEIDSTDEAVHRLQSLTFIDEIRDNSSAPIREYFAHSIKDEVPALKLFAIFDRPVNESSAESQPTRMSGNLVLFGKQTDKPARAMIIFYRQPGIEDAFGQIVGCLSAIRDLEDPASPRTYPYPTFLKRPSVTNKQEPGVNSRTLEQLSRLLIDDFLNMPMDLLGGNSPLMASENESQHGLLRGLLAHFEGEQSILVEDGTIETLYEKLRFERPKVEVDPTADQLRLTSPLDIERIDVRQLSDAQLIGLFSHAGALGASRVAYRTANECLQRESLKSDNNLRAAALTILATTPLSYEKLLELFAELEDVLGKSNKPIGHVVIQRMNILMMLGRHEEAKSAITSAFAKYPSDPYLLNFYQHILQNSNVGTDLDSLTGRQLMARQARSRAENPAGQPESAQTPSGLVLPGSDPSPSGATKSKLWLPGS